MIPTEKLAAACFQENLQQLGDQPEHYEKRNLYIGLQALAATTEALLHAVRKIDQRLSSLEEKLTSRS